MNRLTAEILCGYIAFGVALICGYACLKRFNADALRHQWNPDELPYRRRAALGANLPVLAGYFAGFLALIGFSRYVLPGDRFYPVSDALLIAFAPLLSGAAFVALDYFYPPRVFAKQVVVSPDPPAGTPLARSFWLLGLVLAAAIIASLCGIVFPLLSVGREQVYELGRYSMAASIVWLIAATLVVKMLDGLDGAASILLLLTAGVICYTTAFSIEYLLNSFCIILIGVIAGSIRFHIYPARMALRGGGTLFVGHLFAVLTILARQKSVTAGLVVVPVLLLALLIGGAMLSFLERNLTLKEQEGEE